MMLIMGNDPSDDSIMRNNLSAMENYGKLLLQILSAPNCLGQFSKWMSPRIYIKETKWVRKEGIQKSSKITDGFWNQVIRTFKADFAHKSSMFGSITMATMAMAQSIKQNRSMIYKSGGSILQKKQFQCKLHQEP